MSPRTTSPRLAEAQPTAIRQAEVEPLQRRIDDLAQQVLQARDAVLGAEAELGVVRARVVELEHQVHVRDVEIDELRASVARAGRGGRAVGAGLATGDRVARGVIRRARSSRA